jgi:hypothetical protein
MLSSRRLPLIVAFPAFYVGIAAVRAGEARPSAWILIAVAVAIAWFGARIPTAAEDTRTAAAEAPRLPASRRRVAAALGVSITIATLALETRPGWAALAREIGTAIAMLAAVRALDAIDGDVGLAPRASEAALLAGFPAHALARAGAAWVAIAWTTAGLVDAVAWAKPHSAVADIAPAVASVLGTLALFGVLATALLVGRARSLELDVRPRTAACAAAAAGGIVLGFALALADVPADAAIALGGALAAALVVRLARARTPLVLARRLRRVLTLAVFGGPVAALAAIAVEGRTVSAGTVTLVLTTVALLVGAAARVLEEPFLPAKGVLLKALEEARSDGRQREAREAMAHALMRLREAGAVGLGPTAAPPPELWLLHPTRVLTVDAAGYLQERSAEVPEGIFDVALGEPHATLRTSVLRALEVRRPDLRPFLSWLAQRGALFATVIAEGGDPDGLIVLPAGRREEEMSLEEARAAKLLADAFVAVSQATSAKARHLARELELKARIDALDDEIAKLRHTIDLDVGRHVLASTRLARPATVGIYSAISRMAYDALERRIAQDAPTLVCARAGIDPVPYVARAHLGGPRKGAPFVVVDGTSSREHDLERWTDERTSPLALADRGLLFLVDGAALPRDVQVLVGRAIAERRPPWERATPLDVAVALSVTSSADERAAHPASLDALVESGRLASELAARFEASEAIVLPGLAERPEDLRSIVADRLAREGLRVQGRPVGIESSAYARLVEYPWDGEDAELGSIVTRLVARVAAAGGDVVRAADVDALGLPGPTRALPEAAPSRSSYRR